MREAVLGQSVCPQETGDLHMPHKLVYIDVLWLLKYIRDIVLFLLSRVDGGRGEKVKHHAIVKQLARHSPWAFQGVTL